MLNRSYFHSTDKNVVEVAMRMGVMLVTVRKKGGPGRMMGCGGLIDCALSFYFENC